MIKRLKMIPSEEEESNQNIDEDDLAQVKFFLASRLSFYSKQVLELVSIDTILA